MLKKIFTLFLLFVFSISALAGCGGSTPSNGNESNDKPAGEVVAMTFNHAFTEQDSRGKTYQFFADKVKELSDGTIDIQVYPTEGLVKNQEALKAVMTNTVDMAACPTSLNSNEAKALAPLDVPGLFNPRKWREANEAITPIMNEILAEYKQRYLFATDEGETIFYINNKNAREVHSPADIKGLRIRDHGMWIGKTLEAWGASPMTVVPADVAVAFDRGTVDGGYTGWPFVYNFKLFESAPNISVLGLSNSTWQYVSISDAAWQKLSKEQQEIMLEAAELAMDYNEGLMEDYEASFYEAVESVGGTVYRCTDEERAVFMEASKGLYEEVAAYSGEKGVKLMETLRALPW
ncbi:TRAP transporter substrate-binding protein [Sinanaerobacter chloroacetimidivorans]|jgi:TRAP-type C4-dicarboxylate transport system substrate-binding protein|uniref:TRAP transporter substrate-binding protein n=1 Tax=Sinanaerobacter chloroacetimidivorans TaxID=2818044 RepID=A0A8J8B1V8_9FIRM|nr:TRAP transporter substrate-binding protein [Sinanaerobacter chloroacetimidivorans]MBR0599108.1 TRAP transporter substrate-binding protein [Sinanaerobacter chloroacetimidivorans]